MNLRGARAPLLLTLGLGAACGAGENNPPPPGSVSASASAPAPTASADASSSREGGTPHEASARRVVEWLQNGETARVRALFDDAMNQALPNDEAVASLWAGIEGKFGKLKKIVDANESDKAGYHVVLLTGDFGAAPMDLRLVFDKDGKLAGIGVQGTQSTKAFGPRPQTPKPPFPYVEREIAYDNEKDGMHFGGTLTLPTGEGPFPAVLLLTGSGTQDRDETLFGHKPFLVIADRLTREGIAVLRVDDPGAGKSTGPAAEATIETHARDAEAGLAFLASQKEIDPKRIGLVGHSEGGLIAALVAARSRTVAFVVSLAGTGIPGSEINPMQVESILRADPKMSEEGVKAIVEEQRALMKLVARGASHAELQKALNRAIDVAKKYAPSDAAKEAAEKQIGSSLAALEQPWFKSFVVTDPAESWSKVTVPVLVMNGDKDTQVPSKANLPAIKKALEKAHNQDADIEELAGLNHLFQPAQTGLFDEYAQIETTFDEKALDLMTVWLKKRAKVP